MSQDGDSGPTQGDSEQTNGETDSFCASVADEIGCAELPLGMLIGPYRLLERVGRGGMGVVYRAQQEITIQREVALKVVRSDLGDSEKVLGLFEREREILQAMKHPNIARIIDAGSTSSGQPYFVMEYIHGIPIDAYCKIRRLTTRQRLELFLPVCRAVHYAHMNGVIHRDLTPQNILVEELDGAPIPRVIDFGVATATRLQEHQRALSERLGQIVGTPQYMSPEQCGQSALGVDCRTDVYSLGAVLYQLLVDVLPLDDRSLRGREFAMMERLIKEHVPPPPSARLAEGSEQTTTACQIRGTAPTVLRRQLRGDLDCITIKALAKDRLRRYESVAAFAEDIRRHLDNQPILARSPDTLYILRKWASRRKSLLIAGATILAVTLSAGAIVYRNRVLVYQERVRSSTIEHVTRAELAETVSKVVDGLLDDLQPSIELTQGSTQAQILTAQTALSLLQRIQAEWEEFPVILKGLARAYESVGETLGGIRGPNTGAPALGLQSFQKSLSLYEHLSEQESSDSSYRISVCRVLIRVSDQFKLLGLSREAHGAIENSIATCRDLEHLQLEGAQADSYLKVFAAALSARGQLWLNEFAYPAAQRDSDESIAIRKKLLARHPEDPGWLRDLTIGYKDRARLYEAQEMLGNALTDYEHILDIRMRVHKLNPESSRARRDVMLTKLDVARVRTALRQFDGVNAMLAEALVESDNLLLVDPVNARGYEDFARVNNTYGSYLLTRGEQPLANERYMASVDKCKLYLQEHPENSPIRRQLAISYCGLGNCAMAVSDSNSAIAHFGNAVEFQRILVERDGSPQLRIDLAGTLAMLAKAHHLAGDHQHAKTFSREAIAIVKDFPSLNLDARTLLKNLESTEY